jgi:endoglucanase
MNRVISLWQFLAKRYKNEAGVVGFDIINEPESPSKEKLHHFYKRCIDEIRKEDQKHLIFLQRNLGKNKNVLFGGDYDDSNTALSFHFYDPHPFTYQGTTGFPIGLKYPGTYNNRYWDKNELEKEIGKFIEVAQQKNMPLFVGEFGATTWGNEKNSLQWISDVFDILNKEGIHYTYFCYKIPFKKTIALNYLSESSFRKMLTLKRTIMHGHLNYKDIPDEKKSILHTRNFISSLPLAQMLKVKFTFNE